MSESLANPHADVSHSSTDECHRREPRDRRVVSTSTVTRRVATASRRRRARRRRVSLGRERERVIASDVRSRARERAGVGASTGERARVLGEPGGGVRRDADDATRDACVDPARGGE